jgi:hypothetical protein
VEKLRYWMRLARRELRLIDKVLRGKTVYIQLEEQIKPVNTFLVEGLKIKLSQEFKFPDNYYGRELKLKLLDDKKNTVYERNVIIHRNDSGLFRRLKLKLMKKRKRGTDKLEMTWTLGG